LIQQLESCSTTVAARHDGGHPHHALLPASGGLYYRKARYSKPIASSFEKPIDDLRMQSYDSLPRIPDSWVEVLKVQVPELFLTPVPVLASRSEGLIVRLPTVAQPAHSGRECTSRPGLVRSWQTHKTTAGLTKLVSCETRGLAVEICPQEPSHER
jgi:hypothetical protein